MTPALYVRWGRKDRNAFHILDGTLLTLCGRLVGIPFETRETLPAAKSCESCLKLARWREDAPVPA